MLRAVWWTFRQRRYASLSGAMVLLAVICIGIGTFEIHRYREKRHDNAAIVALAHAPVRPLTASLVPFAGHGAVPGAESIRYRQVTVSGTYLGNSEQYVDDQNQGGHQGFYVLTPLRTNDGAVLVARGFVASTSTGARPAGIPAAPTGTVQLVGRLEPAQTADDQLGRLGAGEITSINAAQQASRLGEPVFAAYLTLGAGQPGTADLGAVPGPDLSNPTGGAGELQLLSYVVQWYAFAILALLAPIMFARGEVREARKRYLGIDPEAVQFDLEPGRPGVAQLAGDSSADGALVLRRPGSLARVGDVDPEQLRRARRLADRYGRSLTFGSTEDDDADVRPDEPRGPQRRDAVGVPRTMATRSSADEPHRSPDEYHAGYNDYLWQLALADGDMPAAGLTPPGAVTAETARPDTSAVSPRVIDPPHDRKRRRARDGE